MGTQRRKRDNRNDSYRSDDYGQRSYRRNSSTNSLTSFLIMALFFAGFVLLFLLFLTFQKSGSSSRNLENTENATTVADPAINTKAEPATVPVKATATAKPEQTSKQSQKASNIVKDLVGENEKEKKAQNVVINILGNNESNKPTEDPEASEVVAEEKPAKPVKANDDEPIRPKSFMGGISNPELEEASKASREERRRKKAEEIE